MSIIKHLSSFAQLLPSVVMILFYGFIAGHYSLRQIHGEQTSEYIDVLHDASQQDLYDAPERIPFAESSSQINVVKYTIFECNLSLFDSIFNQNKIISYNGYADQLVVSFETTDIIFPFHHFK